MPLDAETSSSFCRLTCVIRPADHLAWFIIDVVDQMDLSEVLGQLPR